MNGINITVLFVATFSIVVAVFLALNAGGEKGVRWIDVVVFVVSMLMLASAGFWILKYAALI